MCTAGVSRKDCSSLLSCHQNLFSVFFSPISRLIPDDRSQPSAKVHYLLTYVCYVHCSHVSSRRIIYTANVLLPHVFYAPCIHVSRYFPFRASHHVLLQIYRAFSWRFFPWHVDCRSRFTRVYSLSHTRSPRVHCRNMSVYANVPACVQRHERTKRIRETTALSLFLFVDPTYITMPHWNSRNLPASEPVDHQALFHFWFSRDYFLISSPFPLHFGFFEFFLGTVS